MMIARDIPPPEARELRACGLAALAEAGVVYLPVHLIVSESRGIAIDVEGLALPFVLTYVLGALLACRFRSSKSLATSAVVLAVLAGVGAGHGDLNRSVFAIAVALILALRIVTLGVRDWRTPLHAEIGWFAVALGLETVIASGAEPDWRPLLVLVVPTFFVASLASRASTVWTSGGVHDLDERVRAAWIRRAVLATLALVGAMAIAVILSVRGGLFDRVGRALTPAANAFASFIGWALGQAARPLFWLVDRLGIDPRAVREFFERLRRGGLGDEARGQLARPEAALWQRLLGLFVFVLLGYAVYRVIRRARPSLGPQEGPGSAIAISETTLPEEPSEAGASRLRPELPSDAVRRWYAETLLALERRRISKAPSLTPAEFVPEVERAYPACAVDFLALTRAYEDVRYGSLRLEGDALATLGRRAKHVLETTKRTDPEPAFDDAD